MATGKMDSDVRKYIDQSVLCWLATSDEDNQPNVSPKEMFACPDDATLLIAHIASPVSVKNIHVNPKVCVSFVDVFVQKGYKVKGTARIIRKQDPEFAVKAKVFTDKLSGRFPVHAVIEIAVTRVEKMVAPSYLLFPDTTETGQVAAALKTYRVRSLDADSES